MSLPHQFSAGIRFAALVTLLGVAGCPLNTRSEGPVRRPARGTPGRFIPFPPQRAEQIPDTMPGSGCVPLMYDLGGTQLTLISSPDGRVGDYSVPNDRYGVGPDEAIRLHCNTGRLIGVVPRTD